MKLNPIILIILIGIVFLLTTLSAQSWVAQSTGTSAQIYSVKASDENTVWAGAANGVFLRTTDGGMNWTSGTISGATSLYLLSVSAVDADIAYFAATNVNGGDSRIYKTTDGGTIWMLQYQNTGAGSFFNSIAFWNDTHGIAVGDPVNGSFLVVTTTDGGATWVETPGANIPPPLPGEFAGFGDGGGTVLAVEGQNNAWFGTAYASPGGIIRVLRTTDGGLNWSVANTPLSTSGPFYGISTMSFKDALNGFAGGGTVLGTTDNLAKTTDGGQSWEIVSPPLPGSPFTLVYVPGTANSALVATFGPGGSGYSQDGGVTWNNINSSPALGALSFVNPTTGWAANPPQPGQIYKFMGDLTTSIAQQTSGLPQAFSLMQNYPNPFNPSTTIGFSLPSSQWVTLAIYNTLGQEVNTLLNAVQSAGSYEVQWNGTDNAGRQVPGGLYFYRLKTGDGQAQNHKMILMK